MRSKIRSLISIIRLAGLAVAALAMWGFATIAEEVLEKESYAFDTSILLYLRSLHTPLRDRIMLAFTSLGEPNLLLALSVSLGIILWVAKHRSEATTIAVTGAGAVGLNLLLKKLFARARPLLWERVVDVRFYSFPSGHAMISMVIYGLLGYFLGSRFPKQRWWIYSCISCCDWFESALSRGSLAYRCYCRLYGGFGVADYLYSEFGSMEAISF